MQPGAASVRQFVALTINFSLARRLIDGLIRQLDPHGLMSSYRRCSRSRSNTPRRLGHQWGITISETPMSSQLRPETICIER